MMILGKDQWYQVVDTLTTLDLVALIKCLTIAERELRGWGGGSGSAVIWLFKRLHGIDHDDRVQLLTGYFRIPKMIISPLARAITMQSLLMNIMLSNGQPGSGQRNGEKHRKSANPQNSITQN